MTPEVVVTMIAVVAVLGAAAVRGVWPKRRPFEPADPFRASRMWGIARIENHQTPCDRSAPGAGVAHG